MCGKISVSNIGREFLLIFFFVNRCHKYRSLLACSKLAHSNHRLFIIQIAVEYLSFATEMIILDYFYPIAFLFSTISHLTPWIRVSPTDLIIITREERMPGKGGRGVEFLVTGVYQLSDEEWRYRSYYRPRKLPLRYAGSFVNVDRKITGQVRRKGGQVIGPFPAGGWLVLG